MNKDEITIVKFTNKTDFDFTPEMGARYGGIDYHFPAGKSQLLPLVVAKHFATHLARQTVIKGAPVRDESQLDGRGKDIKLWDEESLRRDVASKFIGEAYVEAEPVQQTEAQRMAARIAALNAAEPSTAPAAPAAPDVEAGLTPEATERSAPAEDQKPTAPVAYKDKGEVIAELEKRGIKFDARQSKANLEKLLV